MLPLTSGVCCHCVCCHCHNRYCEGVTYGELFMQNEYEMSCYNLDEADVADQRQRFALCEAEVRSNVLGFQSC
jgi:glycyl-tRNA synthetase alpha subunit